MSPEGALGSERHHVHPGVSLSPHQSESGNPPYIETHRIEHHHFAPNEYLLAVEHGRDWLGGAACGTAELLEQLSCRGFPGLPEENTASAPPVTVRGANGRALTLFQVSWEGEVPLSTYIGPIWELLKGQEAGFPLEDDLTGATLIDAVPNWYMGAGSHTGVGTHGPAVPPRQLTPIAVGNQTTGRIIDRAAVLAERASTTVVAQNLASEIDVYILDTVPPRNMLQSAWANFKNRAAFREYQEIIEPVLVGASKSDPYVAKKAVYTYSKHNSFVDLHSPVMRSVSNDLDTAAKNGVEDHTPDDYPAYELYDHGLFVAGIIHLLVPSAQLFVLEVLNPYGVGTFLSIADGFRQVADSRVVRDRDAIINCSFTFAFPTDDDLIIVHNPEGEQAELFKLLGDLDTIPDGIETAKGKSVALLKSIVAGLEPLQTGRTAIIVACVGNDSNRPKVAETRYPAKLSNSLSDRVVAVGALKSVQASSRTVLNLASDMASYSNEVPSSGLLAFGGQYDETTGEGLVSVYSNPKISGANNADGMAKWAGTSFATPVATGKITARCLKEGKDPVTVIGELRQTASGGRPVVIDAPFKSV